MGLATIYLTGSSRIAGINTENCTNCHTGSPIFNDVHLQGIPTFPTPGETYTGRIVIDDSDGIVGGFWLQASAGTLATISGQGTQLFNPTTMGHSGTKAFDTAGDSTFWDFTWTAPTEGTSIFTLQGNAANGNFSTSGDIIHQRVTTILLPVTWGELVLSTLPDGARVLDWETYSEINNDHFTIERSTDGINFDRIKTVDAAGDDFLTSYSYTDTDILEGLTNVYYRIKQTDFDGRYSYSKVLKTEVRSKLTEASIAPNPCWQGQYVRLDAPSQTTRLIIYDLQGRLIDDLPYTARFHVAYPNGTYLVHMIAGSNVVSQQKLIVQ